MFQSFLDNLNNVFVMHLVLEANSLGAVLCAGALKETERGTVDVMAA